MRRILYFLPDILKTRYFILQITKRDLTMQYKKKKLGMFWAFAEPLLFMLVLYVVFGIGLRGGKTMTIPFICYLVSGMSVLNFFTSTLSKGTNVISSNSYLLRKPHFRLSILPVSAILTGITDHLIFFISVIFILAVNSFFPAWSWIQLLYYIFALSVFLLGAIWFTSSVAVLLPDIQSVIGVLTRALFYFSPVIWDYEAIPESLQKWVKLNPLFYIVTGYRDSLFYGVPFWTKPDQTLYFWAWTLVLLIVGTFTFRRLRPHFADLVP